jgi:hypothetical protein
MRADIHTPARQAALRKLMAPAAPRIRRAGTIAGLLLALVAVLGGASAYDHADALASAQERCPKGQKTPLPHCTHLASATARTSE